MLSFFVFLFYFFFIFKLYIIVLVLPHIKMNPPVCWVFKKKSMCALFITNKFEKNYVKFKKFEAYCNMLNVLQTFLLFHLLGLKLIKFCILMNYLEGSYI